MRTGKELFADAMTQLGTTEDVFTWNGTVLYEMYFKSQGEWFETCEEFIVNLLPGAVGVIRAEEPGINGPELMTRLLQMVFHMAFMLGYQFKTEVDKDLAEGDVDVNS